MVEYCEMCVSNAGNTCLGILAQRYAHFLYLQILCYLCPVRKLLWMLSSVGSLWISAQGWEPLRDSLLIENERLESVELDSRPFPVLPDLQRPLWSLPETSWEGTPTPMQSPTAPLQPSRPTWTKLAPLHIRYGLGRFWTHNVAAGWGRTRDIERDEGIAFTHSSTAQGHVPLARWGQTHFQAWISRPMGANTFRLRYRGGYEKFLLYAPYAEGWLPRPERTSAVPDSLRTHYWRQELSATLTRAQGGFLRITSRRLDLRRGAPEWQATLEGQTAPYALPLLQGWKGHTSLSGFVEGTRFLVSLQSSASRNTSNWQLEAGLTTAAGRDTRFQFLITPRLLAIYTGLSPALQPFAETQGKLQPLTYFAASELNPYLRRAPERLPLLREWIHAQLGLRGQGRGWDYQLSGEYRLVQQMPLFVPQGVDFLFTTTPRLTSIGAVAEFSYTPLANGPYAEARAAYRSWQLPEGLLLYSTAPAELLARGGYRWKDRGAFSLSLAYLSRRTLSDTLSAPAYVDISWEAHIRLSPLLSLFAQMHNLLNQRFYRWYGYRERPLDFQMGLWLQLG